MRPTPWLTWADPTARVEPEIVAAGDEARIVVTIPVPEGCHVQAHRPSEPFLIPTELTLEPREGISIGGITYPAEETKSYDWTPVALDVYRGTVEIVATVEVDAGARPGRRTVSGRVRYQGCTQNACLPPAEQAIAVALDIN